MKIMVEFVKAALPWVLIAIAVAIFAFCNVRQSRKRNAGEKTTSNRMNEGACFGLCVGLALGTSDVMELTLALGAGMLLGEVIGMCMKKPERADI